MYALSLLPWRKVSFAMTRHLNKDKGIQSFDEIDTLRFVEFGYGDLTTTCNDVTPMQLLGQSLEGYLSCGHMINLTMKVLITICN
jgi:hypothetical protein